MSYDANQVAATRALCDAADAVFVAFNAVLNSASASGLIGGADTATCNAAAVKLNAALVALQGPPA